MILKAKIKINFTLLISIFIISSNLMLPVAFAEDNTSFVQGYEKGVSWKSVVPIKKVTFVNFDEDSFLDDYAYLAAIPTSVFNDGENLFSHPLLFYQDPVEASNIEEITLNASLGIDYFMEDWMSYCYNKLDKIITINVPKENVSQWKTRNYTEIEGETPFDISKKIALHDWSYSDNAVIAVIDDKIEESEHAVSNNVKSTLPTSDIYKVSTIDIKQKNCLNPVFNSFKVGNEYKFINAVAWWDSIIVGGLMIPSGDPDIQLYCKNDDGWMQTSAASNYHIMTGSTGNEFTQSHAYNSGTWQVGITNFPTKSITPKKGIKNIFEVQGSLIKALQPEITYHVDITLYPGIDIKLPDAPPFGCKSADFKLTWSNSNANLGFTVIGPSGEAIFTAISEGKTKSQEIHLDSLGECLPGESYSVSVFSTNRILSPVDFQIEYNFKQEISESERDSLTSASEGAVLASILNAPLLYTAPSGLSGPTKDAFYKLGVRNVYLVDIGNQISQNAREEIQDIVNIKATYKETKQIYDKIKGKTGRNDIIFTTLDPWSYWLFDEHEPAGEKEGSLFIGPATYIAAHHGSPVIIIDNHPRLSSAVVYHNEFWRRFSDKRVSHRPSATEMILTGRRIYDFLEEYDFDKEGLESIITVADQFDIGVSWDRIFPGKANPGRFCGSPVDTSYWIARSVFYPALIFENPAMQDKVTLINGSVSRRSTELIKNRLVDAIFGIYTFRTFNLGMYQKIRGSVEEEFNYPVLCSFLSYNHRFNERASEYYGAKYHCVNGMIPGEDSTTDQIDQGSASKYSGNDDSVFPDMSSSEIVPFYLGKGGYSTAFSTSLPAVVNNLNEGVIMWVHASHGTEKEGGSTLFWDPLASFEEQAKQGKLAAKLALFKLKRSGLSRWLKRPFQYIRGPIPKKSELGQKLFFFSSLAIIITSPSVLQDKNPWRAYEWYLGSTEEPDTMSIDLEGILPFTNIHLPGLPATGMPWVSARELRKELLNNLILRKDPSKPFNVDDLYDGIVSTSNYATWQLKSFNAIEIEESLENLHSVAFLTNMCQTSNTYLHLMLVRHGSVCQVQNPWPTLWYSDVWFQSIPKDIALGYTAGEAYTRGISQFGSSYLSDTPSWSGDELENVVYFGDPDLRLFTPGTKFSDTNHWEEPDSLRYDKDLSINGHTPFGAKYYPHKTTRISILMKYLPLLIIGIVIYLIIMMGIFLKRRREK
jgi:hypothetical protein